jgi:ankyrin repeat protein
VDKHGWTRRLYHFIFDDKALLCAASCGHLRVCSLLLKKGADPKINNDQNTTALHYLVRKNFGDNSEDKKKKRCVFYHTTDICRASRVDTDGDYFMVLQLLLDKGVDINVKNYIGETPLMQVYHCTILYLICGSC